MKYSYLFNAVVILLWDFLINFAPVKGNTGSAPEVFINLYKTSYAEKILFSDCHVDDGFVNTDGSDYDLSSGR